MLTEIVLGPPGTGKTTYLLGEVEAELARGVPPDRIGFVTFTRRAAEEAVSRAVARFQLDRDQLPYFRTLHSMCFRQLGLSRAEVLDGRRLREDFADFAGVRITGRWADDGTLAGSELGDRLIFRENLARVRMTTLREQYESDADGLRWRELERVAGALAAFKAAQGLLDYTDMLMRFIAEDRPPRLDVLFVDEAQDLSALQWEVVKVLSTTTKRVVVAGDDDQAIYAWAGADAARLVHMEGNARVLGQSYRCPPPVQAEGLWIIGAVADRRPKTWAPRGDGGTVTRAASFEEVPTDMGWTGDVQPILVLARNEYVLREVVEPELRLRGVLYERSGALSVPAALLAAIVAWEALRAGGTVTAKEARGVYKFMSAGRGVQRGHKELPAFDGDQLLTSEDLRREGGLLTSAVWHEALDRIPLEEVSYMKACLRHGEKLRHPRPRVRISTIHGSKGGEAEHVVLFREMARRTHHEMMNSTGDDERRVWYVAVTRARERLTVVGGRTRLECPWL